MSQKDSPQNLPHNNATERRRSDIDQNNKKTFVGAAGESLHILARGSTNSATDDLDHTRVTFYVYGTAAAVKREI